MKITVPPLRGIFFLVTHLCMMTSTGFAQTAVFNSGLILKNPTVCLGSYAMLEIWIKPGYKYELEQLAEDDNWIKTGKTGISTADFWAKFEVTATKENIQYRVVVTDSTSQFIFSNSVVVYGNQPGWNLQPKGPRICSGEDALIQAQSNVVGGSYQWLKKINGTFSNLMESSKFKGVKSSQLTIKRTINSDDATSYILSFKDVNGCEVLSNEVQLAVNQSGTIRPTASQIVCEAGNLKLETTNFKGIWKRTEWAIRDSLDKYIPIEDSLKKTLYLTSIQRNQTHFRAEPFFEKFEFIQGDSVKSECGIKIYRNFTITPKPSPPDSLSAQTRCGPGSLTIQGVANEKYTWFDSLGKKIGEKLSSLSIQLSKPDSTLFSYAKLNEKGCLSDTISFRVIQHPAVEILLDSLPEICYTDEFIDLPLLKSIPHSVQISIRRNQSNSQKIGQNLVNKIRFPASFFQEGDVKYTLFVIDSITKCEADPIEISIQKHRKIPSFSFIESRSLCLGESIIIPNGLQDFGNRTNRYVLFQKEKMSKEVLDTLQIIDFEIDKIGVYQFIAENVCERKVSNTFELLLKPTPFFLEPQFPKQVCRNDSLKLSVSVNNSNLISAYQWNINGILLPQTASECKVPDMFLTNFQLLRINIHGITVCGDTISLKESIISILDIPSMSILDSSYFEFCKSEVEKSITWPFDESNTSVWFINEGDALPVGKVLPFTPSSVGTFSFYVQGMNENGCKSTKTRVDLKVSPDFTAQIVATNDFICSTGQLNKKVILLAQVNTNEFTDYQWFTSKGDLLGVSKELMVDSVQEYALVAKNEYCRVRKTIDITAKKSEIDLGMLSSTVSICSENNFVFGLQPRTDVTYDWYLNSQTPHAFYRGDTLKIPVPIDSFAVYISAKQVGIAEFCETDRQKVLFSKAGIFEIPILTQQKCRGNTVNFEVKWKKAPQKLGTLQWQRKRPSETTFTDLVGENKLNLTVRSIGNSTNPSGTLFRLIWQNETCTLSSAEMLLLVNQFTETLTSQVICEKSTFELKSPKSFGNSLESSWQYRATNSGSWSVWSYPTSFSTFPDSLDGYYFRNRQLFTTSDGGTCTLTSDDGRVQVQRIMKEFKIQNVDCGQPLVEIINRGNIPFSTYLNSFLINESSFRLPFGSNILRFETALGCKQDTTWFVTEFERPKPPINQTNTMAFTTDSLRLSALGEGKIGWFLDSTLLEKYNAEVPLLEAGNYVFYLAQRLNDCWSQSQKVTVKIIQSLQIVNEPTSFGTCEGRSARFSTRAIGSGQVRYKWQMKQATDSVFVEIDSLANFADGATTSELRWQNVGNRAFSDLISFRCFIYDENDTLISQTATLQAYTFQGLLMPNMTLCEGDDLDISITSFRFISGPTARTGWQKNTENGWTFLTDENEKTQLFLPTVSIAQEGSYRFSVAFKLPEEEVCIRNSDTFTLKVAEVPAPPDLSVSPFCQQEKVVSLARLPGFGSKIRWYREENNLNSWVENPQVDIFIPQLTNWYISEVTSDKCQSKPILLPIRVHPTAPIPASTTPNPLLITGSATLSANGENLKWYRTKTTKDFSFDPPVFTKKGKVSNYVTSTNSFGCESERFLIQTELVNSLVIERQPVSFFECEGNAASFSVRATSYLPITYKWYQQKKGLEGFQLLDNQFGSSIRIDSSGSHLFPDSSRYVCQISDADATLFSDTVQLVINKLNNIPSKIGYCLPDSVAFTVSQIGAKGKTRKVNWEAQIGGKWTRFFEGDLLPTNRVIDSLGNKWRVNVQFESEGTATCSRTSKTFEVVPSPCFYAQDSLLSRCLQANLFADTSRVINWLTDSLSQTWGDFLVDTNQHGQVFQLVRKEGRDDLEENWFPAFFTLKNADSLFVHLFLTSTLLNDLPQNRWYQARRKIGNDWCENRIEFPYEILPDSVSTFTKYGKILLGLPLYKDQSTLFFRGVMPKLNSLKGVEEADSMYLSIQWEIQNTQNIRHYSLEKWDEKGNEWILLTQTQETEVQLEKEVIGKNPILRLHAWLSSFAYFELTKDTLYSSSWIPFCLVSPNPVTESGSVRIQSSLAGSWQVLWIDTFGRRRNIGIYSPLNQSVEVKLPQIVSQSFTLYWTSQDGRFCTQKMVRD